MVMAIAPIEDLTPVRVAGRAGEPCAGLWDRLTRPAPPAGRFDPEMVTALPEPTRRWLRHAIAPGTPLHSAAVLEMTGRIRLGRWLPFRAGQVQAPPDGYVWAARATLGPLAVTGYDRYADGVGEMRWRLFGRAPVVTAAGTDLDRSAAGRLALDAIFVPTACLGPAVTWHPGSDENSAVAEWSVRGLALRPEITVGPDGALLSVTMPRWANPNREPWGEYPFGGIIEEEAEIRGVRIPRRVRAGYFPRSDRWADGEFFRATITAAGFH